MKRQIKVTISPNGEIDINNENNPGEKQILDELAELAELLNGEKTGFKVEKHTHTHGAHTHTHQHVGGKG